MIPAVGVLLQLMQSAETSEVACSSAGEAAGTTNVQRNISTRRGLMTGSPADACGWLRRRPRCIVPDLGSARVENASRDQNRHVVDRGVSRRLKISRMAETSASASRQTKGSNCSDDTTDSVRFARLLVVGQSTEPTTEQCRLPGQG